MAAATFKVKRCGLYICPSTGTRAVAQSFGQLCIRYLGMDLGRRRHMAKHRSAVLWGHLWQASLLGNKHAIYQSTTLCLSTRWHWHTKSLVLFGGWQAACRLDVNKIQHCAVIWPLIHDANITSKPASVKIDHVPTVVESITMTEASSCHMYFV
jgi:hypothetical protein